MCCQSARSRLMPLSRFGDWTYSLAQAHLAPRCALGCRSRGTAGNACVKTRPRTLCDLISEAGAVGLPRRSLSLSVGTLRVPSICSRACLGPTVSNTLVDWLHRGCVGRHSDQHRDSARASGQARARPVAMSGGGGRAYDAVPDGARLVARCASEPAWGLVHGDTSVGADVVVVVPNLLGAPRWRRCALCLACDEAAFGAAR